MSQKYTDIVKNLTSSDVVKEIFHYFTLINLLENGNNDNNIAHGAEIIQFIGKELVNLPLSMTKINYRPSNDHKPKTAPAIRIINCKHQIIWYLPATNIFLIPNHLPKLNEIQVADKTDQGQVLILENEPQKTST